MNYEKTQRNKKKYFMDSAGNYLLNNDLVRMFGFSINNKKYFMYKKVSGYIEKDGSTFSLELEDLDSPRKFTVKPSELTSSYVVVQRAKFHNDPKLDELKRNKKLSD